MNNYQVALDNGAKFRDLSVLVSERFLEESQRSCALSERVTTSSMIYFCCLMEARYAAATTQTSGAVRNAELDATDSLPA